jgi:type I restriction enzyme S subunit
MRLTAAQQRFIENATLIAALKLVFARLASDGTSVYRLDDIAETTSGGTPERRIDMYYGGDIPWIKSGELNDGVIEQAEEFITGEGLQNSSAKIYPKGTLVVALYGATVGKTGILGIDASSNQAVCAITPKTNDVSTRFLFWFLRHKRPEFLENSFGGAQPNISQRILRETRLPVPSRELQGKLCKFWDTVERRQKGERVPLPELPSTLSDVRRIVARIEALAAKIEEARGLRRQAVEEAKVLLQSRTNQILEEKAGSGTWKWGLLPDFVASSRHAIKRGPFGSHLRKEFFVPSGYKVYEQKHAIYGDFTAGSYFVDEEKFQQLKSFEVKPGDIIISCSGTIGKVAIVPETAEPGIINQALLKLTLETKKIDRQFFKIVFESDFIKQEVAAMSLGSAMKNIGSVKILKKIKFPLPPLDEQRRLVVYLDGLQAKVDAVKRLQAETSAELEALLPSVLDRAFKGEL